MPEPEGIDPRTQGDPTPQPNQGTPQLGTHGEPNSTHATGGEPAAPTDPADQGKLTRVQQEAARYRKVFETLGLDPSSEAIDQFANGVLGKDDLARMMGLANQPPQPEPPKNPLDRLQQIANRVNSAGASEDDFKEMLGVVSEYIQTSEQQKQQTVQQQQFQSCAQAAHSVLAQDPAYAEMPAEIQRIADQLFVSSTGDLVAQQAQQLGRPDLFTSPQAHAYYAQQNAAKLAQLRDHWINVGKQQAAAAPHTPQPPRVTPISPAAGTGPAVQARPRYTPDTLRQQARQYAQQTRGTM